MNDAPVDHETYRATPQQFAARAGTLPAQIGFNLVTSVSRDQICEAITRALAAHEIFRTRLIEAATIEESRQIVGGPAPSLWAEEANADGIRASVVPCTEGGWSITLTLPPGLLDLHALSRLPLEIVSHLDGNARDDHMHYADVSERLIEEALMAPDRAQPFSDSWAGSGPEAAGEAHFSHEAVALRRWLEDHDLARGAEGRTEAALVHTVTTLALAHAGAEAGLLHFQTDARGYAEFDNVMGPFTAARDVPISAPRAQPVIGAVRACADWLPLFAQQQYRVQVADLASSAATWALAYARLPDDHRITFDPSRIAFGGEPKTPYSIEILEYGDRLHGVVRVDLAQGGAEAAAGVATTLCAMLDALVGTAETSDDLCRASAAQPTGEAGELEAPAPTFLELYHACVARHGALPAFRMPEGTSWSYKELDRRAAAFAEVLENDGVSFGDRVLCAAEMSPAYLVALLATWKLGATFVAVAPDRDAQAEALTLRVAPSKRLSAGRSWPDGAAALDVDAWLADVAVSATPPAPRPMPSSEGLAYVMFTSGSTGVPKGVEISTRAVATYLAASQAMFAFGPGQTLASLASPATDFGLTMTLGALAHGSTLAILPEAWRLDGAALWPGLADLGVTALKIIPSHFRSLGGEEHHGKIQSLDTLIFGGDRLPRDLVAKVADARAGLRMFNHYGPTESCIGAVAGPVAVRPLPGFADLGAPLPGYATCVADAALSPVLPGCVGELLIAGPALAEGYLNDPEETGRRFIILGALRWYRTGDLVRRAWSGPNLAFLGRRDRQVKVRGHRVEPDAIEGLLRTAAGVREAVVLKPAGSEALVGFVVPDASVSLDTTALRTFLEGKLPDAMVPSRLTAIEALPRLANGKINTRALEDLLPSVTEDAGAPPQGVIEEGIAGIWSEILNRDQIGRHDVFFAIGGHSLQVMQCLSRMSQRLGGSVSIKAFFANPTIAGLAAHFDTAHQAVTVTPEEAKPLSRYPLSKSQMRIWAMEQMLDLGSAYHIPSLIELEGPLDVAALQAALDVCLSYHSIFQSRYVEEKDGTISMRFAPYEPLILDVVQVADAEDAADRALALSRQPFDLENGPLCRVALYLISETRHYLALCLHHIVSDGWSTGLLVADLSEAYRAVASGRTFAPEGARASYAEFVAWEASDIHQATIARDLTYWREKLKGAEAQIDLPTSFVRPATPTFRGGRVPFALTPDLAVGLKAFCAARGITAFAFLAATIRSFLAAQAEQADFNIGTVVANRRDHRFERTVGCFFNTVVLRNLVDVTAPFTTALAAEHDTIIDALDHQAAPFDDVVKALGVDRPLGEVPLFQVMLVVQNGIDTELRFPGLTARAVDLPWQASKFDLTFDLSVSADGVAGQIEFSSDLFSTERIALMAVQLEVYVQRILNAPEADILTLLHQGAVGTALAPVEILGPEREIALADAVPIRLWRALSDPAERPALIMGDRTLTYDGLRAQALRLCAGFAALGGSRTSPIVIYAERGPSQVAAMLACLWSGRAYVPVDLETPLRRLQDIIAQAAPAAVLTDTSLLPWAAATLPCQVINIAGAQATTDVAPAAVALGDTAYVIFTSGSTGVPKGVEVTHEALANFFAAMDRVLMPEAGAKATWISVSSIAFDISVLELLWPLCHGQKVVIQRRGPSAAEYAARLAQKAPALSLMYFADEEASAGHGKYDLLMAGARFADDNGLAAVWTPERHFGAFGGSFPNPAISSAAIAAVTSRIQIRAGSVVPALHHPMRLCEDWSMIDNLSGGRVGISFASGWQPHDFVFNPQAYSDRKAHMIEAIEAVRAIWRGAAYHGTSGQGEPVELYCRPAPVQSELPFWMSSAGNPATFVSAGEIGANLLTHMLGQSRADLAERIALYRDARTRAAHPGRGLVTVMLHTFVDDDPARARALADGPLKAYLATSLDLVKPLAAERGFAADSLSEADLDSLLDHAVERYATQAGLIGSPASCASFIADLAEIGVDEVACLVDFGVPEAKVIEAFPRLLDVQREVLDRLYQTGTAQTTRDEDVLDLIERHEATHLQCTPALAHVLCLSDQAARLSDLEQMLVGGEVLSDALAERLTDLRRGGALFNMYGPTETTIWSSFSNVGVGPVTLGLPVLNTRFRVLSPHGYPVPQGWRGTLAIGGLGLAAGYLGQPERTAQAFLHDAEGVRWFDTGDTVTLSEAGVLSYLGRKDGFEKVNGFRVETREIEAACEALPEVETALVRIQRSGDVLSETAQILAFLKPRAGQTLPSRSTLRAALLERLPRYACPSAFYRIDRIPLTISGKIDRPALRPEAAQALSDPVRPAGAEPDSATVGMLKTLWAELLGLEDVGVTDNFFHLGGDSVLTIQMASRLQAAGYDVAARHVFEHQTIAALAPHLSAGRAPVAVSVDEVGEAFALTPIQAWFFDQVRTDRDHYNQSLALWLDPRVTRAMVDDALTALIAHHSALRHRFALVDGVWQQAPMAAGGLPSVLMSLSGAETLEAVADRLHTNLDIGTGRLMAGALMPGEGAGRATLVLVLHHLAVDGVSWRILTEDLQTLLQAAIDEAEAPALRASASYGTWQAHLARHARTIGNKAAHEALRTRFRGVVPDRIRPETRGANIVAAAVTQSHDLPPELAEEVLRGLPGRLGIATQEALLSAMHLAFCEVFDLDSMAIDVEGHGRDLNAQDPDTLRSVGWFTALFPICLRDGRADLVGLLRAAQAQLAPQSPTHQEFGCLAYLHPDADVRARAQALSSDVIFNYLGQTPTRGGSPGPVALRSSEVGQRHAPSQIRPHLFNINAIAIDGGIRVEWTYPPDLFDAATITRLISAVTQYLERMVALTELDASSPIVDEFQDVSLDHNEFDALLTELEDLR
ncbi:MupA/Atu3671 family FMN-dependent luciferase-like monooxygenase [Consotaella aegiceratis]|uniref:MupA/Atu3671 family FMN-dependent luciferase-like monooxygenase n=1 Tax=Consotaella aegiceratis TaxID=3097961 RepID=UPI002F3F33CE